MESISPYLKQFLQSDQCYETIFEQQQFDAECAQLVLSKLIGVAILAGSFLLKVPQIIQMLNAGSAAGISLEMYYLEMVVQTFTMVNGFRKGNAFTTYGESYSIIIQDVIIVFLIFFYGDSQKKGKKTGSGLYSFLLFSIIYSLFSSILMFSWLCDIELGSSGFTLIDAFMFSTVPIGAASRIPQLYKNFKESNVGECNILSFGMNAAGAAARVFTTLTELSDPVVLIGFASSALLNGLITLQIIYYNYLGGGSKKNKPKSS
mmetsp:Transcript_3934/g.5898  ORF Transcript_3934/g.5898 Transcript_3934/m.5898 type:complete len:262 (+) Transcript_3934:1-786(+)